VEWWLRTGRTEPLASGATIATYAKYRESCRCTASSFDRALTSIQWFLTRIAWPDPQAKLMIGQIRRAKELADGPILRGPHRAQAFGWDQIKRWIAVADVSNLVDVRETAILLTLFDCLARADQIFGSRDGGLWQVAPVQLSAYRPMRDGCGQLQLRVDERESRNVYVSPCTVTWIDHWLQVRPGGSGALFVGKSGQPLLPETWLDSIRRLLTRNGINAKGLSLNSPRLGAARDLLRIGTNIDDVMRAGGWRRIQPVLRLIEAPSCAQPTRNLAVVQGRESKGKAHRFFATAKSRTVPLSVIKRIVPVTDDLFSYT
jgi:integrase